MISLRKQGPPSRAFTLEIDTRRRKKGYAQQLLVHLYLKCPSALPDRFRPCPHPDEPQFASHPLQVSRHLSCHDRISVLWTLEQPSGINNIALEGERQRRVEGHQRKRVAQVVRKVFVRHHPPKLCNDIPSRGTIL